MFSSLNDHDPQSLYYQFQVVHRGQFWWDYLEHRPEL